MLDSWLVSLAGRIVSYTKKSFRPLKSSGLKCMIFLLVNSFVSILMIMFCFFSLSQSHNLYLQTWASLLLVGQGRAGQGMNKKGPIMHQNTPILWLWHKLSTIRSIGYPIIYNQYWNSWILDPGSLDHASTEEKYVTRDNKYNWVYIMQYYDANI